MGQLAHDDPGPGRRTYQCKVAGIIAAVDAEDRAAIERHLADPVRSTRGIATWLSRNGHPINESTVSQHRNGLCQCARA